MISSKVYHKLKKVISKIEKKRDELIGGVKQLEQTLKKEFGCKSLAEAKALRYEYEIQYEKEETRFRKKLRIFLEKNRKLVKKLSPEDYKVLRDAARESSKTKRKQRRKAKVRKGVS